MGRGQRVGPRWRLIRAIHWRDSNAILLWRILEQRIRKTDSLGVVKDKAVRVSERHQCPLDFRVESLLEEWSDAECVNELSEMDWSIRLNSQRLTQNRHSFRLLGSSFTVYLYKLDKGIVVSLVYFFHSLLNFLRNEYISSSSTLLTHKGKWEADFRGSKSIYWYRVTRASTRKAKFIRLDELIIKGMKPLRLGINSIDPLPYTAYSGIGT